MLHRGLHILFIPRNKYDRNLKVLDPLSSYTNNKEYPEPLAA